MHEHERELAAGIPSGPFGYRVCEGCGVAIQRRLADGHDCVPARYAAHQASRLHWRRDGFDDALSRWLQTPAGQFTQYYARRVVRGAPTPRPGEAEPPRPGRDSGWPSAGRRGLGKVERAGDRVHDLHRLRVLDRLVVHHRARVERRVAHYAVDAAALHAEVAGVVERQDRGLAQQLLERGLAVDAVGADDLHALVDRIEHELGALDLAHRAEHLGVVVVLVEVVRGLPAEVPAHLDARRDVAEHVPGVLEVDDRLRAPGRVGLRPVERGLVGGPRDADRGDAGHGAGPGEVAVDDEVAVAARALDEVLCGDARVVEDDLGVRGEAMSDLLDQVVRDARRAAFDDHRREPLGPALLRVGADHDEVRVRALAVPAGDVARPVLAAVEDVRVAVAGGRHADPYRRGQRTVEVRGPSRRAGGLTRRVADDVLARRIGRRRPQKAVLLLLGAVVPDRQEPEAVDEHGACEARVDRADLLGGEDQVDVAQAAAAVLVRDHAERDAGLVGGDVGVLRALEPAQRVGLCVRLANDGREHRLRELARVRLQLALLVRKGEVDGHPGCASSGRWRVAASRKATRRACQGRRAVRAADAGVARRCTLGAPRRTPPAAAPRRRRRRARTAGLAHPPAGAPPRGPAGARLAPPAGRPPPPRLQAGARPHNTPAPPRG